MQAFTPMATVLTPGELGKAKVDFFQVSVENSQMSAIRAMASGRAEDIIPEGTYARLRVGGTIMMTDTPMEQKTNQELLQRAHGRVLIAGLGLGMVLVPLLAKKEVTSILVVEKSADVLALVGPAFAKAIDEERLFFLNDDIHELDLGDSLLFDTIYFDIWPELSTDDLSEMEVLERKFRMNFNPDNPNAWMSSWRRDELLSRVERRW